MKVVSNSSPLISLARLDLVRLLPELFDTIQIPEAVFDEIVVEGRGRPAAAEVTNTGWIHLHPGKQGNAPEGAFATGSLGPGELDAISLALSLPADLLLLDDRAARKVAMKLGLAVTGVVGILERAYQRKLLADLPAVLTRFPAAGIRIAPGVLREVLRRNGLLT